MANHHALPPAARRCYSLLDGVATSSPTSDGALARARAPVEMHSMHAHHAAPNARRKTWSKRRSAQRGVHPGQQRRHGHGLPHGAQKRHGQRDGRQKHGPAVIGEQQASEGIQNAEQKPQKRRRHARPDAAPHMHVIEKQRKAQMEA